MKLGFFASFFTTSMVRAANRGGGRKLTARNLEKHSAEDDGMAIKGSTSGYRVGRCEAKPPLCMLVLLNRSRGCKCAGVRARSDRT